MNKLLYFICVLTTTYCATGQERVASWESSIALNYQLKEWKLNTSVGHRTTRLKNDDISSNELAFLEVNQFISRKLNPLLTASFGYKYRSLDPTNSVNSIEQRLTQQVAYIHLNQRIRLLSRLRAEQRFFDETFQHRYRYRFSMDAPLNGLSLDLNEFYLVASNEILIEFYHSDNSIDDRISIGIGYVASPAFKVQVDFTHRIENLGNPVDQIPFLSTALIFNL